ncbi:MAG: hypothetical protein ABR968_01005 [Bacteroidales bacterium]|jgi:hypothetical protein
MRKLLLLLFAPLILISFFSCKKHIENKLKGDWRQVNVINVNQDTLIDWIFDTDGSFSIIQTIQSTANISTQAYGKYVIKDKLPLFRRILDITSCSDPNLEGNWRIMKLSSKYLEISIQKADLTYYEFTKQD